MPVNTGSLGQTISFSDLQTYYGGSHPISLSEYYRGAGEVPRTAIAGANPYTGTTSFSGSGSGSGGSSGIGVNVQNSSTTTGGGTLNITQGFVAAQSIHTFSWTGGGTIDLTVSVTAEGVGITCDPGWFTGETVGAAGLTVVRTVTRGNAEGRSRIFTSGDYSFQNALRIGSGNQAPGGLTGTYRWTGTVTGSGQVAVRGPSVTTAIVTNSSTGAPVTVQRRTFTFTNNTGQVLNFSGTGNGAAANNGSLGLGASVSTGVVNGASEAWSFNYNYLDAGSGSGSSSTTTAGIGVAVASRQVTVNNPGGVAVTLGGDSGRDVMLPEGQVDFTMTIGSVQNRTEGLFTSDSFDFTGLSTDDLQPIFGNGRPRPGGNGLGTAFAGWFIPNSAATITVRVTGTIATALTWVSHPITTNPRPSFSLVNNAQTTTATVQDISFTNNAGRDVIFSSGTTGGARTLTNGASAQVQNGGDSSNWSFAYRYAPSTQPANTAIPESGTTSLDQFNAPGNAAP